MASGHSPRAGKVGQVGEASNSVALVTMWSGNLALFMYLCAGNFVCGCVCVVYYYAD